MKFTIGFVVGAAIGRPVLKAVSRRINLTQRIERKVATVTYNATSKILKRMEEIIFEDGDIPTEDRPRYRRGR